MACAGVITDSGTGDDNKTKAGLLNAIPNNADMQPGKLALGICAWVSKLIKPCKKLNICNPKFGHSPAELIGTGDLPPPQVLLQ